VAKRDIRWIVNNTAREKARYNTSIAQKLIDEAKFALCFLINDESTKSMSTTQPIASVP